MLSATSPCILASGAPRQKWAPAAKLRCGLRFAADVEPVGVGEGGGVAVGSGQEQQARLPGRARNAVDVGVGAGCCSGEGGRGDQPQHFLDGGGPAPGVFLQGGQRLGVGAEQVGAQGEQGGGGLVPGVDEENAVREQVLAVLACPRAGRPGRSSGHRLVLRRAGRAARRSRRASAGPRRWRPGPRCGRCRAGWRSRGSGRPAPHRASPRSSGGTPSTSLITGMAAAGRSRRPGPCCLRAPPGRSARRHARR